ncbi:protein phosphatase 1 regulatory inhibitor subunit PPP1R8 homolog isoform X3 [Physcomitrium patens]|nr:protein phosphatase 1 regulatory inhibitor subunit PPP1R8 homolog isoform X3 [Physcomitrium patens]|eukprot:XP_024390103.1 protein phosphatase 1 regulatory inhibitor subunit PPP1R8 homolog isoform X3 [Physcomitrella patens]
MLNRYGMDRFKKAESVEPFSVNPGVVKQAITPSQPRVPPPAPPAEAQAAATSSTSLGQGGSNWQPPEWAAEFKNGVHVLEVVKDGTVVDKISLEKRRALFGRQALMCDYVLDHPSVSRQHAAVVLHKNGSVYVIDLGSVHGTFVANERLTKDNPVELEVGQSLRFAASTRTYVLRKVVRDPPTGSAEVPAQFVYPPGPDMSDEEAVVAYNTNLNKLGAPSPNPVPTVTYQRPSVCRYKRNYSTDSKTREENASERPTKRIRKSRVSYRDEYGGILAEVVGISDGADVSTEPGPIGVREGSLVGKYESLVQVTVIPKGKDDSKGKVQGGSVPGVTEKLKQYLEKVKSPGKGGLYEDMYSVSGLVGSGWAGPTRRASDGANADGGSTSPGIKIEKGKDAAHSDGNFEGAQLKSLIPGSRGLTKYDNDDLFGDAEDRSVAASVVSKS